MSEERSGQSEPVDVRYDVSDWSRSKRRDVAASLWDGHLEFRWDGSERVVSALNEAFVDTLVDDHDEQPQDTFLSSLIGAVTRT